MMQRAPGGAAVFVAEDAEAAERQVARQIADLLAERPDAVLGLATGRSIVGVYRELVRLHRAGSVSFSRAQTFNLDEYCGLAPDHPASFASYMQRHLFGAVDLDPARARLPDGSVSPQAYEQAIAQAGGIDLQLLGIGRNGHIAFNEPGSDLRSRTRVVTLAEETRAANAADFGGAANVPREAVSMGISTILEARRILLLATGPAKADALAQALEGRIGPHNPASFLRLHAGVTIICDTPAARLLTRPTLVEGQP